MSTLAIAARSFNTPAETFIRDHVRTIAPGKTILLCQDGLGAEKLDAPFLADIQWHLPPERPTSYRKRVARAIRMRWHKYIDPGLEAVHRRRVLAFFDMHRPKALLAEFGTTGCLFMRTCEIAGVPLYVHFHGYDATILPATTFIGHHYKRLFSSARAIIVTTEFLKRRLIDLGCPEKKLSICPCGVDTRTFVPGDRHNGAKKILMVNRLMPQKGPLLSIRSFAMLSAHHPDATLDIVGDGPLRAEAEAEAEKLGIVDRVRFHGAQPHEFVRARLREARMLIQHCVTLPNGGVESLGLSLLEAMACQVPIVATRHGAIPETVEDGVTGVLVHEGDVSGMAAAMRTLLDNPERALAMGAAGRRRVLEHFTLDQSRDRLRAIMGFEPLAKCSAEKDINLCDAESRSTGQPSGR